MAAVAVALSVLSLICSGISWWLMWRAARAPGLHVTGHIWVPPPTRPDPGPPEKAPRRGVATPAHALAPSSSPRQPPPPPVRNPPPDPGWATGERPLRQPLPISTDPFPITPPPGPRLPNPGTYEEADR